MTTKTKKKELWTDKDRQGLAEKKGLNLGSILGKNETLHTNKDRQKGLADKKGLDMGSLFSKKDKEEGLL